jgi:hypothetical protein
MYYLHVRLLRICQIVHVRLLRICQIVHVRLLRICQIVHVCLSSINIHVLSDKSSINVHVLSDKSSIKVHVLSDKSSINIHVLSDKSSMYYCWYILLKMDFSRGVLNTSICDQVSQWLATGQWFSQGTLVSSTNKTDRHDITEILLKVVLKKLNKH